MLKKVSGSVHRKSQADPIAHKINLVSNGIDKAIDGGDGDFCDINSVTHVIHSPADIAELVREGWLVIDVILCLFFAAAGCLVNCLFGGMMKSALSLPSLLG